MRLLQPLLAGAISLGLLWALFRSVDPGALGSSLEGANYLALLPAVLVYFGGLWLRGVRWGLLLRPVAVLSTAQLYRATLVGFAVNDVTPIRLGELARVMLLARWAGLAPAATLGTIVVERLFDGLTLCAILGLTWLRFPLRGWLAGVASVGGLIFALGTIGATLAAFAPGPLMALARRCARPLPGRWRERGLALCSTFLSGLAVLRRGRVLLLVTALSFLAWAAEATMYYLIMRGFAIEAGPLAALLGMAAGNLGTLVPSSPGFVGTFDVPLKAVLTDLFGVPPSLALSYTLVVHAALFVPVVLIGLGLLWREGLSLGDVRRHAGKRSGPTAASTDPAARTL